MVLVLFEVIIKRIYMDSYLSLASNLKNALVNSEGFILSERFSSLVNEGKLLSLSVWENEEAVNKWRNQTEHRISQRQGHDLMCEGYTMTVASGLRSYTINDRAEAPGDSNKFFDLTKS